jgi:hypothetical protein
MGKQAAFEVIYMANVLRVKKSTIELRLLSSEGLPIVSRHPQTVELKITKYIYSNKNPNLTPFSTLILGTKVPQLLFV